MTAGLLPNLAPSAVIIGSGRSGTGYISTVLKFCGVAAGHEAYFALPGMTPEPNLTIDVSWLALPHLSTFAFDGGRVWHQRRHPLDVISSMYWIPDRPQYVKYRESHPDTWPHDPRGTLTRLAQLWIIAEEHAAAFAEISWNVENINPKTIRNLCGHLGAHVTLEVATRALDITSKTVNRHRSYEPRLRWDELDGTDPTIKQLRAMANAYGYK